MPENELVAQCRAALAVLREQLSNLALIGFLDLMEKRMSALEFPNEAPTRKESQKFSAVKVERILEEGKR